VYLKVKLYGKNLNMIITNNSGRRKWDGTGYEPDQLLWVQLETEMPEEICRRALVRYNQEKGFLLPFLNQIFQILPKKREIVALKSDACQFKSFELDLIIITYLLGAQSIGLEGKIVNEKQIPGGETFFRGPHLLPINPMEELFGEDREAFLRTGKTLKGEERDLGDAAICLPVFPRVPVTLILWVKDDEFPARITVNFDRTISRHLPLDIIWTLVNVVSKWMTF
jgi:hypothetical protein